MCSLLSLCPCGRVLCQAQQRCESTDMEYIEQEVPWSLEHIAKASDSLSATESREAELIVCAALQIMKDRYIAFAAEESKKTLLVEYVSDCTPLVTQQAVSVNVAGKSKRRRGPKSGEYYVQQSHMARFDSDGVVQRVCMMFPGILLQHGKTMPALLACTLRSDFAAGIAGNECITIRHAVFDRANRSVQEELGVELFRWHTATYCAAHDASNALRWSLDAILSDASAVDNLFAVVAAFRHGSTTAVHEVHRWVNSVVLPIEPSDCEELDVLVTMWSALGVIPEHVNILAGKMRLCWSKNRHCVSRAYVETEGSFDEMCNVLMSIWSFKSFTLTRWGTVGISARSL
eukprot:5830142-Amphidinium_carterae.1